MPDPNCPAEEELLAALAHDPRGGAAELQQHLAQCASCRKTADRLASGFRTMQRWSQALTLVRAAPPIDAPIRNPAQALTFLDKYFVGGVFRTTDSTTVYRAAHVLLKTEVLIYLWRKPVVDPPLRDAVVGAGQRLAQARHPGLPVIRDLSFVDGKPFLVADAITGVTLDRQALPLPSRDAAQEAARRIAALAEAVAALHAQGQTHGEVSLANVLLDEQDRPWLIGAGVAGLTQLIEGSGTNPPAALSAVDTPGQFAAGDDLRGLGQVLFFLITGQAANGNIGAQLAGAGAPPRLIECCQSALAANRATPADGVASWTSQLRQVVRPGIWSPSRWFGN